MSQFSDERGSELRELFFETAQELLQSLNEEALKLEQQPGDGETVRTIRRIVHTLKGDSAAAGFPELSELAHKLEDALALESASAHDSLTEIVFSTADIFAAMLTAYRNQSELPSTSALRKKIAALARDPNAKKSRSRKAKAPAVAPVVWSEYEKLAMQEAAQQGKHIYCIQAQIDPHCAMPIAARQLLIKALNELGSVLGSRPEPGSTENTPVFQILVASNKSDQEVVGKCRIPTVIAEVKVDTVEIQAKPAAPEATESLLGPEAINVDEQHPTAATLSESAKTSGPEVANTPKTSASSENILRVDAERIDAVLNLVGELIIGKSMLQQAINEFARHYPKDPTRNRFADAMAFQSRVLNDLQRSVMKVRMVPVEQLFRRFPRIVRDVAKHCGKDVQLVLRGQDTDLDKGLLDAIAEPLTHLVRNAVDHGIETPEQRQRAGKPAQGTIFLDAYHQANHVIVEVSDDGGGIDAQKVKAKAIERSILTAEKAARLSETEILQFIFQPGFSTAEKITAVSGRGVGLDVVQTVLQRLKGSVQVETRVGQGTRFRLQLPLTLAIIKALLFRVEQRLYAIPLSAVGEIARAHESDLHLVDGCEMLQRRNQVLPVIRLGSLPKTSAAARDEKIFVLVINMGERKFGLLVNALEGEEELVIKALDDQTVETDLVSGASILGDGRVVLILNLAALIEGFTKLRQDPEIRPVFGLLLSRAERGRSLSEVREAQS
ncbi:MAG: chemotaxis protein CheA [Acidobacteriaceae bacterium]|nr:chemotaxis protein CheA [Acidobacteriaceae bacterium]